MYCFLGEIRENETLAKKKGLDNRLTFKVRSIMDAFGYDSVQTETKTLDMKITSKTWAYTNKYVYTYALEKNGFCLTYSTFMIDKPRMFGGLDPLTLPLARPYFKDMESSISLACPPHTVLYDKHTNVKGQWIFDFNELYEKSRERLRLFETMKQAPRLTSGKDIHFASDMILDKTANDEFLVDKLSKAYRDLYIEKAVMIDDSILVYRGRFEDGPDKEVVKGSKINVVFDLTNHREVFRYMFIPEYVDEILTYVPGEWEQTVVRYLEEMLEREREMESLPF